MNRGSAPAQGVVVHAGQIVVHQAVAVNEFNGAGYGQGVLGRATDSFGPRHGQDRAKAFATGKEQVAHRGVKRDRRFFGAGQQLFQCGVNQWDAISHVFLKIHPQRSS